MTDSLIIVPVYPPDFHWATKMLDSAPPSENIALGFSNQNDADSFHHSYPYKTLVSTVPEQDIGYIGKKKLDLLKQTYTQYKYVAIVDCEVKFLQPVTNCLEEIWNNNCFLGNHSVDGSRMMKEVAKLCGLNHDDDLYPWFNCIPVFKTELLPGFFKWLDVRADVFNSFFAFEFLLFALYCRYELSMPWVVLDGHAWHGLVENSHVWEQNRHLINQVVWSTYFRGVEKYPNIKMLFHLDRYPAP